MGNSSRVTETSQLIRHVERVDSEPGWQKRSGDKGFWKRFIWIPITAITFLFAWYWCTTPNNSSKDAFELAPLIDGHNDFAIWIRAFYQNHLYQKNFTAEQDLFGQVDFPRLTEGRLRGQFWSVYVECPKDPGGESKDKTYREIVHDTLQQVDIIYRLIKEYPSYLQHAYSAADIRRQFWTTTQISSLLGIEGLHQIGNSASILRMYHALGVRYATLTHTCHNRYADSEEPTVPLNNGLSAAGRDLVREMNRLGMMVDLSHTSFATQRDALAASVAPVVFTHSNALALHNHTRNVPDDVLRALQRNGGVVMCTFYPAYTASPVEEASLMHVADHIEYIGGLIGYRHVGIGSDFDGMDHGVKGLEDVSKYPDLIRELERRGVARSDVLGIMGLNVLRVLEEVEEVAKSLSHLKPLEDDVKPFFG